MNRGDVKLIIDQLTWLDVSDADAEMVDVVIAGIEKIGNENAKLENTVRALRNEVEMGKRMCKQLMAEIAALKAAKEQEPVAWCVGYDDWRLTGKTIHSNPTMCRDEADAVVKHAAGALKVVPLYLHPAPSDRDALDARRYRWAKENPDRAASVFSNLGPAFFDSEFDMFIKNDAAMQEEKQ